MPAPLTLDVDRKVSDEVVRLPWVELIEAAPTHDALVGCSDDHRVTSPALSEPCAHAVRRPNVRVERGDAVLDALVVNGADGFGIAASGCPDRDGHYPPAPGTTAVIKWVALSGKKGQHRESLTLHHRRPFRGLGDRAARADIQAGRTRHDQFPVIGETRGAGAVPDRREGALQLRIRHGRRSFPPGAEGRPDLRARLLGRGDELQPSVVGTTGSRGRAKSDGAARAYRRGARRESAGRQGA